MLDGAVSAVTKNVTVRVKTALAEGIKVGMSHWAEALSHDGYFRKPELAEDADAQSEQSIQGALTETLLREQLLPAALKDHKAWAVLAPDDADLQNAGLMVDRIVDVVSAALSPTKAWTAQGHVSAMEVDINLAAKVKPWLLQLGIDPAIVKEFWCDLALRKLGELARGNVTKASELQKHIINECVQGKFGAFSLDQCKTVLQVFHPDSSERLLLSNFFQTTDKYAHLVTVVPVKPANILVRDKKTSKVLYM